MPTEKEVLQALSQIQDPDLHKDIVTLGFVKNMKISGSLVSLDINLTTPACPVKDKMQAEAKELIRQLPGVSSVDVKMTAEVRRTVDLDKSAMRSVKNIVAVASGKGGVGKSTVAVNLAVAMAQTGAKVGLLDADIYGPTVRMMMGEGTEIEVGDDQMITPAEAHGIKFMSMGFMAPGDKPLIWRGPMAHHALQQCLFQVKWGDLDYLFMDLPPGTGDVHLTLVQSVSITGAVMVSTPQDVGLTISMKTYRMFETTNVRTLGIIENMSYHLCPHCGQREEIFGNGGVADAAKRLNIPFLGEIPLDTRIREQADKGIPIVAADPAAPLSGAYRNIAEQLAAQISIASYGSSDGKEHKEGPQKLKPRDIQKVGEDMMKITWNDGHESKLSAYHLRENCRCATCRNEHTGEKILPPGSVPRDIKILKQEVIGNYALAFVFSDGHSTGIYSYQYLRDTCPCCVEAHAA